MNLVELEQKIKYERTIEISFREYFNGCKKTIIIDDEIEGNVEQTDLYEATMVAATGSIADGLADLSSQFKSG